MRKILRQKFWSLGTPLGSLGPGSQGDVRPRACKCQIQVIWGPCEPSVLVALQGQAENPKTAGAWCEYGHWTWPKILCRGWTCCQVFSAFWGNFCLE